MDERRYTVLGRWPFPHDMLKRDGARGATPADAALIQRFGGESSPDPEGLSEISVDLVMDDAGMRHPNHERWESFGWSVVGYPGRHAERALDADTEARRAVLARAMGKLDREERDAVDWFASCRVSAMVKPGNDDFV